MNKTVDWFLLDYAGDVTDPLIPELSEDIDLCRWVRECDLMETSRSARGYLQSVWSAIEEALNVPSLD